MNQDLYINILMTNEVNNKLKSNPLYIKYLREHSYYYKLLNRDPNLINGFIEEAKKEYKLRSIDRISKLSDYMDLFSSIVSNLKYFSVFLFFLRRSIPPL